MRKGKGFLLPSAIITEKQARSQLVFQSVGASTEKMTNLKAGDAFRDFTDRLDVLQSLVHEDLDSLKNKR